MNPSFIAESRLMRFFRAIGCESIAWSLRRLHCPVDSNALVLEVGSGGNPYYRANVLLDAFEDTRERHWVPLVSDRPTVLGFVENLPFRDKVFDFVIASHVLEHSSDPSRFLGELQRVAKAGYIEVPDAFMERVNPYLDHRLEITVRDGRLVIRKKKAWRVDTELVELYKNRAKAVVTSDTIPRHPFAFHVRYYWRDHIDYVVVNPEKDACWQAPVSHDRRPHDAGLKQTLKISILAFLRTLLSQRRRNRALDLYSLLACPVCGSDELAKSADVITCNKCATTYAVRNGIPVMYSSELHHNKGSS